jgi:hypothetical protein
MARKLIVEVIADAENFVRGLKGAEKASSQFAAEVTVSSKKVVDAQIAASVKTQARLREQIVLYQQVAVSAEKGSAEQVAAARLAGDAQNRLQRELGQTSVSYQRTSESVSKFERELSRSVKGALSGTGIFRGLTRSLAFASGGYLAFRGVTESIQKTISVAQGAAVAERSLQAQMRATGESFKDNQTRIEQAENSLARYGFTSDDSAKALTVLDRATGSITRSMGLQVGVANLARAKNIDLASAAAVVAKVFGGQETALRRAVPGLDKQAHGLALIAEAFAKLRGQAAAATTPSQKFNATLFDTEKIIGTALLPIMNQYLGSISKWLDKANRTGEIQRDAAAGVKLLKDAIQVAKVFVDGITGAFNDLNTITGSTKRSLEFLVGAFAAFKTAQLLTAIKNIATNIGLIGSQAETATTKTGLLSKSLLGISQIGAIVVTIDVLENFLPQGKGRNPLKGIPIAGASFGFGQYLGQKLFGGGGGQPSSAMAAAAAAHPGQWVDENGNVINQGLYGTAGPAGTAAAVAGRFPGGPPGLTGPAGTAPPGASASQRNTWFDQMISRSLDRVQDIPTLRGQISRLRQIATLVQQRIAATKDVTRKLTLGDTLVGVTRQMKTDQQQITQNMKAAADAAKQHALDAAQVAVDRAGLTVSLTDDLAALRHQLQVMKAEGATDSDIVSVLLAIKGKEAEIAQAQKDRLDAVRQQKLDAGNLAVARAGLTTTLTDDLRANQRLLVVMRATHQSAIDIVNQQKAIQGIQDQITQQRQDAIDKANQAKVDSGNLAVAKAGLTSSLADDLAANKRMLAILKATHASAIDIVNQEKAIQDITKQMAGTGDVTKFRHVSATSFLGEYGQGLTPGQRRSIAAGLAAVGPSGTVPTRTGQFALASSSSITVTGGIHLHGVQNVPQLENELHKRAAARPQTRRGAR